MQDEDRNVKFEQLYVIFKSKKQLLSKHFPTSYIFGLKCVLKYKENMITCVNSRLVYPFYVSNYWLWFLPQKRTEPDRIQ
jgi:hypothetical protein